jgi:ubiquinone/menaquinone biosynthesis C-methylase UbiE
MREYSKTISRFYDAIYNQIRSPLDLDFYLTSISDADGPVLEVGVGTGRIFCKALESGADIHGIDISDNMLEVLKGKLPSSEHHRVTQADMIDFDLGKKFKLIIVPFRIFQHLLTIEEQLSALSRIKHHLDEDGKLVFDVFVPNIKRLAEPVINMHEITAEYAPGKMVERYFDAVPHHLDQVIDITFTFKWKENGEEMTEQDHFPFRYYFKYELEHLIARADLEIQHIFGNFNGEKLNNSSNDFVIVCNK